MTPAVSSSASHHRGASQSPSRGSNCWAPRRMTPTAKTPYRAKALPYPWRNRVQSRPSSPFSRPRAWQYRSSAARHRWGRTRSSPRWRGPASRSRKGVVKVVITDTATITG